MLKIDVPRKTSAILNLLRTFSKPVRVAAAHMTTSRHRVTSHESHPGPPLYMCQFTVSIHDYCEYRTQTALNATDMSLPQPPPGPQAVGHKNLLARGSIVRYLRHNIYSFYVSLIGDDLETHYGVFYCSIYLV